MKLFYPVLSIIGFILLINSCKNPEEDPCQNLKPTSADFMIQEDYGSKDASLEKYWPYYSCDTVATPFVRFVAIDSTADSYEWHIGAKIYKTRSVGLRFPDNFYGNSVPIKLILKKKANLNCFPNDKGIDSLTKNVYFIDPCQSLIAGDWFGYNEGTPTDTFTVNLKVCQQISTFYGITANNLYRGCFSYMNNGSYTGYKALLGYGDFKCQGLSCSLGKSNDELVINYSYFVNTKDENATHFKFIGKRKK